VATPILATVVASTPVPRPVEIPLDEGSHDDQLEWWYYNGHLTADDGSKYGFHYVIFQARQRGFPTAYVGQIGVTDLGLTEHVEGSKFFLQSDAGTAGDLELRSGDWELVIDESGHRLTGTIDGASLTLSLVPDGRSALHNEIGWLSLPTGWTYYYSWPRMRTAGTLITAGRSYEVQGTAWMDHQWGDFEVPGFPAGWQWFAIQFDDDTELMLNLSRNEDGEKTDLWGTFVNDDGNTVALTEQDDGIYIDILDTWTSSNTGGEYPAGWRIAVDSIDLELELWPVVDDQEIPSTRLTPIVYWEGTVSVSGTRAGSPVSGNAYAELTGYAKP
jgi:predicted secreted hydrolase